MLGLYWEDLVRGDPVTDFATVYDPGDERWRPAYSKTRYTTVKGSEHLSDLNDGDERARLGKTGLQPFFTSVFANQLPNGTIRSPGLMELHQPSWFDKHPGEECIYCLRGKVKMIVRDQEYVLGEGACLVFNAFEPHKYIPLEPGPTGEAPLIFIVLAVSQEDALKGVRTWPSEKELEAMNDSRIEMKKSGRGGMAPNDW